MTNLRQQIEEIEDACPKDRPPYCPMLIKITKKVSIDNVWEIADEQKLCQRCNTDRIISAIKAKVEGMPLFEVGDDCDELSKKQQLKACKSYLMGELG